MWPAGHSQTAVLGNGAICKGGNKTISTHKQEKTKEESRSEARIWEEQRGGGGGR